MEEIWKSIKNYEGEYEVSNLGNVRSIKFGKNILLKTFYARGYKHVDLYLKGKSRRISVHRLVAGSFIENPENKRCVNHKDGIKDNNDYTNLEWVTHSENTKHACQMGLLKPPENRTPKSSKKVLQIDKDTGVLLREYISITSAGRESGIDRMNIKNVCKGTRKSAGGYVWTYK